MMSQKMNPGPVRCLGPCGFVFESKDKATNRICPICTKKLGRDPSPRTRGARVYNDNRPLLPPDA